MFTLAASSAIRPLEDFTQYALVKGDAANRELSADQVADALKDYDVIFIGEIHDHPGNHLAEMALFRALHTRAPKLALSMEMFERDVQPVMDKFRAGGVPEAYRVATGPEA